MKTLLLLLLPLFSLAQKPDSMQHSYTYLALGDSYTIGEAVPLKESFPYQVVQNLRVSGQSFGAPEIIAKTGWTTDELEAAMKGYAFMPKYDFVSLLIGVNNQFRGLNIISYKEEFERLLRKSIELAGGDRGHVLIISIPDYSATSITQTVYDERNSQQIDAYNALNKAIAIQYKVQYVEITEGSRDARSYAGLVASDGLHPSAKEYAKWAKKISLAINSQLKK